MPFDPKDFLKLSWDLFNDTNYHRECALRTCISRSYYSAFLVCRTWLEAQGITFPPTAEVHKNVVQNLRALRKFFVADVLDRLRRKGRNKADYNLRIRIKKNATLRFIRDAEFVINSIP